MLLSPKMKLQNLLDQLLQQNETKIHMSKANMT